MSTRKFQVFGEQVANQEIIVPEDYQAEEMFIVHRYRGDGDLLEIETTEDHLVEITFDDGTFWLGSALELPRYFDQEQVQQDLRGGDTQAGTFILPNKISQQSSDRGLVDEIFIKAFKFFKPKASKLIVDEVVKASAKELDKRIQPQTGIFSINADFVKTPITSPIEQTDKPYLLFLHGTVSSFEGSFGGLLSDRESGLWQHIVTNYSGRILAFEHHTLSEDVFANVAELLNQLPNNVTLDIISQSRGGLIGELLSLYHYKNKDLGFNDLQIAALKKEDAYREGLEAMIKAASNKKINIKSFIRVAAPAAGTHLCSKRLDLFLNALISGFQLLVPAWSVFLQPAKKLLSDVLASKQNNKVLPGLEMMAPDSTFQAVLNSPTLTISSPLCVIQGNAQLDLRLKSIITLISKLIYLGKNDWIVDTSSMNKGIKRNFLIPYLFVEGPSVNHFQYFKNIESQRGLLSGIKALENSVPDGFHVLEQLKSTSDERGVITGSYLSEKVSGNKPVLLILPGILGSNLSLNGKEIYLNLGRLASGGMTNLAYDAQGIKASSLVGIAYHKFGNHFDSEYDVVTFPFDWRLPLKDEARRLNDRIIDINKQANGQPIKIVAHSMGGLLARHFVADFSSTWEQISKHPGFRLIFMGSPLGGSYLIPEVIIGEGSRIKQMAKLDLVNGKFDLLSIFKEYEGLLNLLPLSTTPHDFGTATLWNSIQSEFSEFQFPKVSSEKLQKFNAYRKEVIDSGGALYRHPLVCYIAGKSDQTTDSFVLDTSQPQGYRFMFTYTENGDGSVTWESGIPKEFIGTTRLYYVNTSHGDLVNDKSLFKGISELLINNITERFSRQPLQTKKGFFKRLLGRGAELGVSEETLTNSLLGIEPSYGTQEVRPRHSIEVCVTCGDMFYAKYPVLLGHLSNDAILGSEAVMDKYLDNQLSMRYALGIYPDEIGTSTIVTKEDKIKAIIVGLGSSDRVSTYRIEQSVSMAIKKYLLEVYDKNKRDGKLNPRVGLSFVLLGSGYLGFGVSAIIQSILRAANRANEALCSIGFVNGLLDEIEFIELCGGGAVQAYVELNKLESRFEVEFTCSENKIRNRPGRRRRFVFDDQSDWWTRISITLSSEKFSDQVVGIEFTTSSKTARAEKYLLKLNKGIVLPLIEEMSTKKRWTPEIAKTLFELLIPNEFKYELLDQQNIILQLDAFTTQFPWELIFDTKTQKEPLSVRSGLIRQLSTETFRKDVYYPSNEQVLVIGNPNLEGFMVNLEGAENEVRSVAKSFKDEKYLTTSLINTGFGEIVCNLFPNEYKIIHIAGHGQYDPKMPDDGGIVIGHNKYLKPSDFNNLSYVPEMVFVNCCYVGNFNDEAERSMASRNRMAASIGAQLIQLGVKVVIVAGWAIADGAAELFASTFYQEMLKGEMFGNAVKKARAECYQKHGYTNTWGAYQAYGNHAYKLKPSSSSGSSNDPKFLLEKQIEVELYNLKAKSDPNNPLNGNPYDGVNIFERLKAIEEHITKSNIENARIYELLALGYMLNNAQNDAIRIFELMKKSPKALFTLKALEDYLRLKINQIKQGQVEYTLKLEKINDVIQSIEHLLTISNTADRFIISAKASLGLFEIQLLNKKKFDIQTLTIAKDAYLKAFELSDSQNKRTIYPLFENLILEKAIRLQSASGTKSAKATKNNIDKESIAHIDKVFKANNIHNNDESEFIDLLLHMKRSICVIIFEPKQISFDNSLKIIKHLSKNGLSKHEIQLELEKLELYKQLFLKEEIIHKFLLNLETEFNSISR
jgi:hypothetical protein